MEKNKKRFQIPSGKCTGIEIGAGFSKNEGQLEDSGMAWETLLYTDLAFLRKNL